MAESEEELKSLLIRVKEESEKAGLKFSIQETKIMASSPMISWQIDGEKWKPWQTLFSWAQKSLHMVPAAMKLKDTWVSLVAQTVKSLAAMQETQVLYLGQENPLEKGRASHSNILAWRIPWTEETDGLHSIGSQRVRHSWATNTALGRIAMTVLDSILKSRDITLLTKFRIVKAIVFSVVMYRLWVRP